MTHRNALADVTLIVLAAALVTGCGGSAQKAFLSPVARAGVSWMHPDASKSDLLYVADQNSNQVDVYSYPDGKAVGALTGFNGLAFLCTDSAGDVFIPSYADHEIFEYAHGGSTPIATLQDPNATPYSCSFDPATGNLAIANYTTTGGIGTIAIYAHAKGKPRVLDGPGKNVFCAYDNKSNLFIESYATGSAGTYFEFEELPKGARTFGQVTLDTIPAYPVGLQWNGSYMAVGTGTVRGPSSGDTYIYHMQFQQGIGKTIGSTHLVESGLTTNFYVQDGHVVVSGGDPPTHTKFFAYPEGGSPTKTLTESAPTGVVVSGASKSRAEVGTASYQTLFEFNGSNGASPAGQLLEYNGKLYGTTMAGGRYGHGTVFSISPNGKESVLHSFGASGDGKEPEAGLVVLHGILYGTTYNGGPYNFGTVFSVTLQGSERVLHHFGKTPDGQNPTAGLTVLNGTLFGTTMAGGESNGGTVYSITPSGTEHLIYRFPYPREGKLGAVPWGGLITVDGELDGTTTGGGTCTGGTVFRMTTAGKWRVLHALGCRGDGRAAMADLFYVGSTLYGTTSEGGPPFYDSGVIFSVADTDKETVLTYFPSPSVDGAFPRSALVAAHGLLFGTTSEGGQNDYGVVFSITPSGDETVLHNFGFPPDGETPLAGLTNLNGTLYGTTSAGGGFTNNGTVFKITF